MATPLYDSAWTIWLHLTIQASAIDRNDAFRRHSTVSNSFNERGSVIYLCSIRPSLDSFFKRKNPQVEPYSRSGNNAIIDLTDSPPNKKIKLDDDNNQKNRSMTQTSSSYFKGHPTARPLSVYKEPPRKPSTAIRAYKLPHVIPSQLSRSGSAFETCSLVPQASFVPDSQPEPSACPTPQRTTEQLSRHEEWTTRILAMSGSFRRRRSLALDEAAAAEVREAAGLEDEGTFFDGSDGDDYKSESEKNAEEVGKQLKKYVAKELAGKAKSKGKKKEEIGPSGLAYTPLEKQFMEIKEQNRDVLLLMEGELFTYSNRYNADQSISGV